MRVAFDVECCFRCVCLVVCVNIGPKSVISCGEQNRYGWRRRTLLTARLIKLHGGLRLMKSTAAYGGLQRRLGALPINSYTLFYLFTVRRNALHSLCDRNSVHLSVRPPVTLVDCVHMVRPTIMISSSYGSPIILHRVRKKKSLEYFRHNVIKY